MDRLLTATLLVDLLSPLLISSLNVDPQFRYFSTILWGLIAFKTVLGFRFIRSVDLAIFIIVALYSTLGFVIATLNGQNILITAWGWWLIYKGPILGLYVFQKKSNIRSFTRKILNYGNIILVFEVLVQIIQYSSGVPIGDQLGGTFGEWGTQALATFLIIVFALNLSAWIIRSNGKKLLLIFLLCLISSMLSSTKIFPFVAVVMGVIAIIFRIEYTRRLLMIMPTIIFIVFQVFLMIFIFSKFLPSSQLDEYGLLFNKDTLHEYYFMLAEGEKKFDVGRNIQILLAWNQLKSSKLPVSTIYWGDGLGARAESNVLGDTGIALRNNDLGAFSGTSLTVLIGEMGIMGIISMIFFYISVVLTLWISRRRYKSEDIQVLKYGILIFSICWPILLWYASSWSYAIPSFFYWCGLGLIRKSNLVA